MREARASRQAFPLVSLESARSLIAYSIWRNRSEIRRDRDSEGRSYTYDAWIVGYIQGAVSRIMDSRTHEQVDRIVRPIVKISRGDN